MIKFLLHLDQARQPSGGGYIAMRRLARGLRLAGHDVRETAEHRLKAEGKALAEQYDELSLRSTDILLTSASVHTRHIRKQAQARGVPVVAFVHAAASIDKRLEADLVVWGSRALRAYAIGQGLDAALAPQDMIMYPLIYKEDVRVENKLDSRITLVNLSENKGGKLFFDIAEAAPNLNFLAVKGWGEQALPKNLPFNVEVVPWISDPRNIYERTKVLLYMKGENAGREWLNGVGLTALEAAVSGIPTVAYAGPGLVESLGKGYQLFCSSFNPESWVAAILHTLANYDYYSAQASKLVIAEPSGEVTRFLQYVNFIGL